MIGKCEGVLKVFHGNGKGQIGGDERLTKDNFVMNISFVWSRKLADLDTMSIFTCNLSLELTEFIQSKRHDKYFKNIIKKLQTLRSSMPFEWLCLQNESILNWKRFLAREPVPNQCNLRQPFEKAYPVGILVFRIREGLLVAVVPTLFWPAPVCSKCISLSVENKKKTVRNCQHRCGPSFEVETFLLPKNSTSLV